MWLSSVVFYGLHKNMRGESGCVDSATGPPYVDQMSDVL